jgi:hypothetical protein
MLPCPWLSSDVAAAAMLLPHVSEAFVMFQQRPEEYKKRVKLEAAKYPPPV